MTRKLARDHGNEFDPNKKINVDYSSLDTKVRAYTGTDSQQEHQAQTQANTLQDYRGEELIKRRLDYIEIYTYVQWPGEGKGAPFWNHLGPQVLSYQNLGALMTTQLYNIFMTLQSS